MRPNSYLLAVDQGTTSSRALLINQNGQIVRKSQREFPQIFPHMGWVEHDPEAIWKSQFEVMTEVIASLSSDSQIAGIGITNQRETTVIWNRKSGQAIANAIVWQDRRTADFCEQLKKKGHAASIQAKTGLVIDAYFSASKIKWLLDNIPNAREQAQRGELAFGTIDSWLIWKLTGGRLHATDVSNASRTMLFDIHKLCWDKDLLDLFEIPESLLPEVKGCSEFYAGIDPKLFGISAPICGVAGDQQSAMFGQLCFESGDVKNTYGTGCFLMLNTGSLAVKSNNNLLTTIAWKLGKNVTYALEGSVFAGGSVIQWIRDGLGLIGNSHEIEPLAQLAADNGGVYFVPAFTGLGAPYWDAYARGSIFGLTRGSNRAHIARAALESIAYQSQDVLTAMLADSPIPLKSLRVDGGASANNQLMQFQADILNLAVIRPATLEATALGVAYLAGLAIGIFKDFENLQSLWVKDQTFAPVLPEKERTRLLKAWRVAVQHSRNWIRDLDSIE